jgi:predicted AAA+ superfamily ATPase
LIQASYSTESTETRDREIKALLKGMEEQNLDTGIIYTHNYEEEITIGSKKINIIPFWKILSE